MWAPRRLSSWARQTYPGSQLLAPDVLKPPIRCNSTSSGSGSWEDVFPHAETSAAGAARYDRLLRSQVSQPPRSSSSSSLSSSWEQQQRRPFSTSCCKSARYGRMPSQKLNRSPGPYLLELERRYAAYEYQARKELQTASDTPSSLDTFSSVGWQTPAELSRPPSQLNIPTTRLGPSLPPSTAIPKHDADRDLVSRSIFRHQLLISYDFLEDLHRQVGPSADKDELNREKLPAQLAAVVEVVAYVAGVRGTRGRRSPPILPADATAFRIVLSLLVFAQIKLGFRMENIIGLLGDMRKVCTPLLIPSYHQLLAAAGVRGRFDLVEALWQDAYSAWAESTDEWMLYARAKAWAGHGRWQDLKTYWQVYMRCSLAPPEAYGRLPKPVNTLRKLHPPRYLFTLLLEAQIDSQRQANRLRQNFAGARAILRAMCDHGYDVGQSEWLLLLKASPNLRLRLPDLLKGTQDLVHIGDDHRPSILLALLRTRARALAVRDVIKLLRLMGAELASASRKLPMSTSSGSIFFPTSSSEKVEAYSLAATVFGNLGHPERARRYFEACWKLRDDDPGLKSCTRAVVATITGYKLAGQHEKGLVFGRGVLTMIHTATARSVLGAMLRLSADITDEDEALAAVRSTLDLAQATRVNVHGPTMRRSLAPFFFRAIGTADNDLGGVYALYADLNSIAYGLDSHSNEAQPRLRLRRPAHRPTAMTTAAGPRHRICLAGKSRRRLRLLLQTVQASGFEDALVLRDQGAKTRKAAKLANANEQAEENAEWMRSTSDFATVDPQEEQHVDWMQSTQTNTAHHHHHHQHHHEETVEDSSSPVDSNLEDELNSRQLTSAGYAMRLRVYSVLRRDHHSTAFIYQHMTSKRGIRPTMFHIAPIIEGLCQDGRVDEARAIARQAQSSFKVLTTLRVQTSICRALIALGRESEALRDYHEWMDLGGKPDVQLQAILANLGIPRFASQSALLEAIELAQQTSRFLPPGRSSLSTQAPIQSFLPISDIDAAYRYLMSTRRYLSAQQLVWWSLRFTDFRMDYELKTAVRDSKNLLGKIYRTKERQSDSHQGGARRGDAAAAGEASQMDTQAARRLISTTDLDLSQLTASIPPRPGSYHGSTEGLQEDTPPLLGEALRVQAAIMQLSSPDNAEYMAKLTTERAARKSYRRGLLDLVVDLVRGKWNLQRTSARRERRRRRFRRRRGGSRARFTR